MATPKISKYQKEALYWEKLPKNWVKCLLCFRKCTIKPNSRGLCGARENKDGKLYSIVYSFPCAVHIDPIEKEPAYHVFPGASILCLATAGCTFKCKFCHNWHISQFLPEEVESFYLPTEKLVELAIRNRCIGVSFTYTEPTIFYEYMLDISKKAKEKKVMVIVHTCGAINTEPLKELLKYVDAVTVDLKGFTEDFYKKAITDGSKQSLESTLNTLKTVKENNVWLEIVNLVIPGLNDNPKDIEEMCKWIVNNLGQDVPLHFSRFYPSYKFSDYPPTPISTLEKAREIAIKTGIRYVTIGNVPGHSANSTFCYKCGKVLIKRHHFSVLENNIVEGKCKFCNTPIKGIWEKKKK